MIFFLATTSCTRIYQASNPSNKAIHCPKSVNVKFSNYYSYITTPKPHTECFRPAHSQTSIQTNVISQSHGGDDQTLILRDQAGGLLSLVCVGGY